MFGEIAHRYDFLNHFLSLGTDIYWRWRTVRAVKLHDDSPLLDVCTGTGDLAFAFRKKLPVEQPVVGSDFTHEMLKLANQKSSQRSSNDNAIAFLEADTQQLPFADDLFQVVSVAFGIRNVNETRKGLAEMTRVCQPHGHILILEFTTPKIPIFKQLYRWYFRNVLPRIGQFLARNRHSAYRYLPDSVSEFPERDEFTKLMLEMGLENVSYRSLTFGIATLYQGRKPADCEEFHDSR